MPHLLVALALSFSARAGTPARPHPGLPLRPITYPVDPKLTDGPVVNFRELDVSPDAFVQELQPVERERVTEPVARPAAWLSTEAVVLRDPFHFVRDSDRFGTPEAEALRLAGQLVAGQPAVGRLVVEVAAKGGDRGLARRRARAVVAALSQAGVERERLALRVVDELPGGGALALRVEDWDASVPAPEPPPAEVVREEVGTGDLPIVNLGSSYAHVEVNGKPLGTIGPLTNGLVRGVPAGWYEVRLTFQNGYSERVSVHTIEPWKGPLAPGGEAARPAVEDPDAVPSWATAADMGYVGDDAR